MLYTLGQNAFLAAWGPFGTVAQVGKFENEQILMKGSRDGCSC